MLLDAPALRPSRLSESSARYPCTPSPCPSRSPAVSGSSLRSSGTCSAAACKQSISQPAIHSFSTTTISPPLQQTTITDALIIIHLRTMHAITIPPRTSMNPNIDPLLCRKPIQYLIVQINERLQEIRARPRVPRIFFGGQPPLRKVDGDARGTGFETPPDVLFAFVY